MWELARGRLLRANTHFVGRLLTSSILMLITAQSYWLLNDYLTHKIDLMTSLDRAIPFLPWTMAIYMTFYPMLLVVAYVCDAEEFGRLLWAVMAANFTCYVFFILLTSHYPRPHPDVIESVFWRRFFLQIFAVDPPGNTFPSIHVALTFLVGLRMRLRRGGWIWFAWCLAICVSTLTVKQHYAADLLAGIGVALACNYLFYRRASASV